jgi:predicted Fe-Mo cluster-binding NifX family protein
MKIAITSDGTDLQSAVDSRFGRAKNFVIYDTEDKSVSVVDNVQNLNAMQGAGIQSAKTVIESGAKAVLTGNMGPKAFSLLNDNGVEMYINATGTIADAIDAFTKGSLKKISDANVEGHWV